MSTQTVAVLAPLPPDSEQSEQERKSDLATKIVRMTPAERDEWARQRVAEVLMRRFR